ncbi:MAG: ribose-phosphate pyrophosphokinase [Parachlamydiaceae bacterium]|nr:ribose-phosphate pyrophosphokinase [Parachlamydiaceae bacterium]
MLETKTEALLFSGTSHPVLAKEIADLLNIKLGQISIEQFPDGETSVQLLESVRGRDTFVLQSVALNPDHYLVELLIIIDALKRASARSIAAVIPYYGYCRQDRKDKPREPITAKLVANMLEHAGVTRVLTIDLHAGQIQGFFDVPVDNLCGRSALAEALEKLCPNNLIVVAPDVGSIKRARAYAKYFKCELAVIDKSRISATKVKALRIIGDVEGKDVLLADDMCSTAGTLVSAAKACREKGAKRIFAVVTHGLLVGDAVEAINKSPIEALLISNTIPHVDRAQSGKIHVVSIAPLISQAISCIISRNSIKSLYDDNDF